MVRPAAVELAARASSETLGDGVDGARRPAPTCRPRFRQARSPTRRSADLRPFMLSPIMVGSSCFDRIGWNHGEQKSNTAGPSASRSSSMISRTTGLPPSVNAHGVGPLWWGGEWWSSLGYAITCGMRQPRNFATDRCCHLVSRIANRAFYLSEEAGGWRTTFLRFSPKGQGGRSRFAACSGLPVRTTSRRSTPGPIQRYSLRFGSHVRTSYQRYSFGTSAPALHPLLFRPARNQTIETRQQQLIYESQSARVSQAESASTCR